MLDLAGIMFSSVMMLMVIIQAVRLDHSQPWFQSVKRKARSGDKSAGVWTRKAE